MYDELNDVGWWQRYAVRIARKVKRWRTQQWLTLAASTFACLVFFFILTYIVATPDSDALAASVRASGHYGSDPTHVDAYRWSGGVEDGAVCEAVIEARRALRAHASSLVLVSAHASGKDVENVVCSDLFSIDRSAATFYDSMFHEAIRFLYDNADELCVCAPEFGRAKNYLAIHFGEHVDNLDLMRGDDAQHAVLEERAEQRVLHMLNVVDNLYDAYDTLDEQELDEQNAELHVSPNEQVAQQRRYNYRLPAPLSVVRRKSIRLEYMDRQCHRSVLTLSGPLAVCVQRCVDLMHGKNVHQRALAQQSAGIELNRAALANFTLPEKAPPPPPTPAPTNNVRDEL